MPAAGTRVDVLLAPVSGPWLKVGDVVDYVRAVGPRIVVPIHDAMNSEAGNGLADRLVATLGGTIEYRRLGPGDTLAVGLSLDGAAAVSGEGWRGTSSGDIT